MLLAEICVLLNQFSHGQIRQDGLPPNQQLHVLMLGNNILYLRYKILY